MKDVLKDLHASLAQPGHNKVLTLEGKIKYVDEDSADMMLEKAAFNNKHIVFEVDKDGKRSFFFKESDAECREKAFLLRRTDELACRFFQSAALASLSHKRKGWSGNRCIPDSREFQAVDVRPVSQ